jgi:hypothetical protein
MCYFEPLYFGRVELEAPVQISGARVATKQERDSVSAQDKVVPVYTMHLILRLSCKRRIKRIDFTI